MTSQTRTGETNTETTAPVARYRKTKGGSYVVIAPWKLALEAKRTTGTITVTKKDGTTKTEACTDYGRRFEIDGEKFVYIRLPEQPRQKAKRTGQARRVDTGDAPRGYKCDECKTRWAYHAARDMSGIAGYVCGRCIGDDGFLSFA